jgi:hypothetical protein
MKICKIEGCNGVHRCKGYCDRHYTQIRRYGKILNTSRGKKDKNDFIIKDGYAEMLIFDNNMEVKAIALLDIEDIEKCKICSWSTNSDGYVLGKVNKLNKKLHRFILDIEDVDINVDHINRNKLDNRKENLRLCTKGENTLNVALRTDNTSGYKGVYKKKNGRWTAHLDFNRKRYNLGTFTTAEEAAIAYNKIALQYHGEFAYQNEVNI